MIELFGFRMLSVQKMFVILFVLVTIVSIYGIVYSMNLFLGAYEVAAQVNVSINGVSIKTKPFDPTHASVLISLTISNPTEFPISLVYLKGELSLNRTKLGECTPRTWYNNPIKLYRSKNATVEIKLESAPSDVVAGQSPKTWTAKLYLLFYDFPLFDKGYFTRYAFYPD